MLHYCPEKIRNDLLSKEHFRDSLIKKNCEDLLLQYASSLLLVQQDYSRIVKEALEKNGLLIQYVDKPTPEMQEIALKQNPKAVIHLHISISDALNHNMNAF
jgi:hypothetical protein